MRFGNAKGKRQGRALNPAASAEEGSFFAAPAESSGIVDLIPEARVVFDTATGHVHDGVDSHQVSYRDLLDRPHDMDDHTGTGNVADIASVGAVGTGTLPARVDHTHKGVFTVKKSGGTDIHGSILLAEGSGVAITQAGNTLTLAATGASHNLLSATHPDTTAASVVQGDLIYGAGASPKWSRLAKGGANTVLKMGANEPAWGNVGFGELSGVLSAAQHGAISGVTATHALAGDASGTTGAVVVDKVKGKIWTVPTAAEDGKFVVYNATFGSYTYGPAGTLAPGDLLYYSSGFQRLAVGTGSNIHLKAAGGVPVWGQVALAECSGAVTATGHGNQASVAGTSADHSGTLSATARVGVRRNTAAGLVGSRRELNLIEGTGITLAVTDDSVNERLNVVIGQSGSSGISGIALKEGGVSVPGGASAVGLDFGAGFDLTAASNVGAIALDLSEVVTGDLLFSGNDCEVRAINGWPIGTLPEDSGRCLQGKVGGFIKYVMNDFPVVGWSRSDISAVGTTNQKMVRVGQAGNNVSAPWVPARNGYLTGVSVATDDTGTVGAGTYTVEVYKNGVATGLTVAVSAASQGYTARVGAPIDAFVSFSAGERIELYEKRTGTLSARGVQACLYAVWEG